MGLMLRKVALVRDANELDAPRSTQRSLSNSCSMYARSSASLRIGQTLTLLDSELGVRLLPSPVVQEVVHTHDSEQRT